MVNYLDLAKRARQDKQRAAQPASSCDSLPRPADTGGPTNATHQDKSDQGRSSKRAQMLTVEEALKEMERPLSGSGIQARLYRAGEITRENAIKWVTCAIIYRRMNEDARREAREYWEEQKKTWQKGGKGSEPIFFVGWERDAKATEEALDRFFDGRVYGH